MTAKFLQYRAKMRISSDKMDATLVHTGPVFSVDDEVTPTCKEAFQMDLQRFADFNHGFDYFGDHNRTENGDKESWKSREWKPNVMKNCDVCEQNS